MWCWWTPQPFNVQQWEWIVVLTVSVASPAGATPANPNHCYSVDSHYGYGNIFCACNCWLLLRLHSVYHVA